MYLKMNDTTTTANTNAPYTPIVFIGPHEAPVVSFNATIAFSTYPGT